MSTRFERGLKKVVRSQVVVYECQKMVEKGAE